MEEPVEVDTKAHPHEQLHKTENISLEEEMTALEKACEFAYKRSGDCPGGEVDWDHPDGCDKVCAEGMEVGCWQMYFEGKQNRK